MELTRPTIAEVDKVIAGFAQIALVEKAKGKDETAARAAMVARVLAWSIGCPPYDETDRELREAIDDILGGKDRN